MQLDEAVGMLKIPLRGKQDGTYRGGGEEGEEATPCGHAFFVPKAAGGK